MLLREVLLTWSDACEESAAGNHRNAAKLFKQIKDEEVGPRSRIIYNLGAAYMQLEDWSRACTAFRESLEKDEHFAICYFQLGITLYKLKRYEDSIEQFKLSYSNNMRGNYSIDYTQLGLLYRLHAYQALHNLAVSHAALGRKEDAIFCLTEAKHQEAKWGRDSDTIQRSIDRLNSGSALQLVELPENSVMFCPPKSHMDNIEKQDYLGTAKVVSTMSIRKDKSNISTPPTAKKFDHSTFVPAANALPSGEVSTAHARQGAAILPSAEGQQGGRAVKSGEVTVKLCYSTVRFLLVKSNIDFTEFQEKVCQKLNKTDGSLIIWYEPYPASDLKIQIGGQSDFAKAMKTVRDSRLTVWCQDSGGGKDGELDSKTKWHLPLEDRDVDKLTVAVYSYTSEHPADLSFEEGDVIEICKYIDESWFEGKNCGKKGLVPFSYVKPIS